MMPRVIREKKRKIKILRPPGIAPMKWSTSTSTDIVIHEEAASEMITHCTEYAREGLEAMGFMLGDFYKWEGSLYTDVVRVVTGDLDASHSHVRFSEAGLSQVAAELDHGTGQIIVGWYHSHPGFGCFMSSTDWNTQQKMFSRPYHIAVVVDPINREAQAYRISNGEVVSVGMGVYSKR